jgi:hypothetical protein
VISTSIIGIRYLRFVVLHRPERSDSGVSMKGANRGKDLTHPEELI